MQDKFIKYFSHLLFVLFGNALLAFGIVAFASSSNLIVGGSSGIAFVLKNFTNIPISITVLFINIIALILGIIFLNKEFVAGTLVSTFAYPIFLALFEKSEYLANLTQDNLLSAIYVGICMGVGLGIVFRLGYSTGGLDIPPLIFNKKFGVPVGMMINIIDIAILIIQVPYSNVEGILYGIIAVVITAYLIDRVMLIGENNIQVVIISNQYEQIASMIYSDIDRGFTYLNITTGYLKNNTKALMVVLSRREYVSFNEKVQQIDPAAFIIANNVHSVKGRGFSMPDINIKKD